jgi:glycosyltransferase involved in cell wall biosynthesis
MHPLRFGRGVAVKGNDEQVSLVLDDVVYGLQSRGGVSRVWECVSAALEAKWTFGPVRRVGGNGTTRSGEGLVQRLLRQRWNQVRKFMPVLVFGRSIFLSSYYRVAIGPGVSNVLIFHDCMFEILGRTVWHRALRLYREWLIWRSKLVICVSESTRDDVLRVYPRVSPQKLVVIPNPLSEAVSVGADELGRAAKAPGSADALSGVVALYIGRRVGAKNFWAIKPLIAGGDCVVRVVGDLPSPRELAECGDSLPAVNWLGPLSDRELRKEYAAADFLFLPSVYEGFGLPAIEAVWHRLPVVYWSGCKALAEVLDGEGHPFDRFTSDSIKIAVQSALSVDLRAGELARSALLDRYSPKRVNEMYFRALASVARVPNEASSQ